MKGFDPRWSDLPDYILGITNEIWEGRGIAELNHLYAENIPMRFPSGLVQGNQAVIDATLATLAEFPDRQLFGEDVIWAGNDEEGFLSSHRILSTATHLGGGYFGDPTGKSIVVRAIADCAAKNNVIYDEWLIRDTTSIVKQLGMEPKVFAQNLIEREGGVDACVKPFTPADDIDGGYSSSGNDNKWGTLFSDILSRIMNKEMDVIRNQYDRACQIEHPGGASGYSWARTEQLWMALRSAFPTAEFKIEHQIGREDPMMPPRAAVRWSLCGNHDGWGLFGNPTGANVYVMGISHAEFGPWGLRREYTLYDEVMIWKQILMQTG